MNNVIKVNFAKTTAQKNHSKDAYKKLCRITDNQNALSRNLLSSIKNEVILNMNLTEYVHLLEYKYKIDLRSLTMSELCEILTAEEMSNLTEKVSYAQ